MVKGAFLTEHLILFSGWGSWDLDVLISREVSRFIIVRKNQSNKKKRNRYIIGAGVMSCHWIFFFNLKRHRNDLPYCFGVLDYHFSSLDQSSR